MLPRPAFLVPVHRQVQNLVLVVPQRVPQLGHRSHGNNRRLQLGDVELANDCLSLLVDVREILPAEATEQVWGWLQRRGEVLQRVDNLGLVRLFGDPELNQ